jgi:YegS/Rv2252/BmrU family lipid kinase
VVRKRETVLFIVNPVAGSDSKRQIPDRIVKSLDSNRFIPSIVYSKNPGNATEIAKEHYDKGIRKIVAVGGDGTVNEVAKILISTNSTLGIIPLGSGNGLARHLKIPFNINLAVNLINRDQIAMLDFGLINQTPFFCTAGVGFDALVGYKFGQLKERGFTNYVKTTIKEFFRYQPQSYTLRDNGQALNKEAFLITVANASQFGNNAYIAPNADVTDGMLDVTIISPFPKFLSPSFGIKLFNRKLGRSRYVEMFRIKQLTIERKEPGFVHFDGEPASMEENLTFKVKPMGLNVFVP